MINIEDTVKIYIRDIWKNIEKDRLFTPRVLLEVKINLFGEIIDSHNLPNFITW